MSSEKKEQYLKVYWYTGKDQVRPLNAVKKQRNCHIKFAAYDDEVVIIGNGNQGKDHSFPYKCLLIRYHLDSQSWFHSQEVNVMIDSKVNKFNCFKPADTRIANCGGDDGYTSLEPEHHQVWSGRL